MVSRANSLYYLLLTTEESLAATPMFEFKISDKLIVSFDFSPTDIRLYPSQPDKLA